MEKEPTKAKKQRNPKPKSSKKADGRTLSDDERKKLAGLVEQHPELWSLSHPNYKKPQMHVPIWMQIGASFNITAEECKKNWRSVRDALRYQLKGKTSASKLKPKKSGDSGDEASDNDNGDEFDEDEERTAVEQAELESWPLYNSVKFLCNTRGSRKTISTPLGPKNKDAIDVIDAIALEAGVDLTEVVVTPTSTHQASKSNYDYAAKKKRKVAEDSTEKLAAGIQDLINLRKDQESGTILKYHSMYANLDRMLTQLPEDTVEDLNYQFITIVREEMKKKAALD